jgi:PmbA protein
LDTLQSKGGSLIGPGRQTAPRIAERLLDALDTQVFGSGITIVDYPHRARGLRSKPFDGEGLPTQRRTIIENGRLTTWLLDSASARQLGLQPTGHASRGVSGPPGAGATNLHMEAGDVSPAELMADIKEGFYVTDLIGHGVNGLTGDYSRGASGFVIRNGQIEGAVAEVTIAGNLKEMFRTLTPANDLDFRHGTNAPTLRLEGMTLAGD